MEMKTPGKVATFAALAVGALFLSNRMKPRRGPRASLSGDEPFGTRAPVGKSLATAAALAAGGLVFSRMMKSRRGLGSRSSIEESIEIDVPVTTAYNQWTQFEEFPRFMDSVQEVRQLDDTHLHWRANFAGKT